MPRFPGASSQWSYERTYLILPATVCGNTYEVLLTSETHLSLGVQGFYLASVPVYLISAAQSPAPLLDFLSQKLCSPPVTLLGQTYLAQLL